MILFRGFLKILKLKTIRQYILIKLIQCRFVNYRKQLILLSKLTKENLVKLYHEHSNNDIRMKILDILKGDQYEPEYVTAIITGNNSGLRLKGVQKTQHLITLDSQAWNCEDQLVQNASIQRLIEIREKYTW